MKHGKVGTREYRSWSGMKNRCTNPSNVDWSLYGGRGIKVCERWRKFENFYQDMFPRPVGTSLDRIDNNGPYSPENCRWSTVRDQSNNRRTNARLSFRGVTQTIAEWSREIGICYVTLYDRLRRGWSVEKALTQQIRSKKK